MDIRVKETYINAAVDETITRIKQAGHQVVIYGVVFGEYKSSTYFEILIAKANKAGYREIGVRQDVSNCGGFSKFVGTDQVFKEMRDEYFPTIDSLLARVGCGVKKPKNKREKM